ncbi:hypothetical protein CYLTODRAFT_377488 [Cylindrobasidium torrendii FP15055 ss-10]|uniref:C2H2-type domain-containing protein n=1 Tax=Cylindrobasidium torrendii FP15055 ss-10 TaxID=1314674 RepID=A0A0D7B8T8_9AGAR|nr:hypothetical protein CYLTODRAFT_377488 [Cylindrobasidium torrendii FP15055 ss-10]
MILHSCSDCDYSTRHKGHFEAHRNTHTGARPFACTWPNCTYAAAGSGSLSVHMSAHKGIRRHRCDWEGCDYAGPAKERLNKHKARHTGPRPFLCLRQGCRYSTFECLERLLEHRKTRHPEVQPALIQPAPPRDIQEDAEPVTLCCQHKSCDYTTRQQHKLDRHQGRHTPATPYVCSRHGCRFVCAKRKELKTHIASAHEEKGPATAENSTTRKDGPGIAGRVNNKDALDDAPEEQPVEDRDVEDEDPGGQSDSEGNNEHLRRVTRSQKRRRSSHPPSHQHNSSITGVDNAHDDGDYVAFENEENTEPPPKRRRQSNLADVSNDDSSSTSHSSPPKATPARLPTPSHTPISLSVHCFPTPCSYSIHRSGCFFSFHSASSPWSISIPRT